MTWRSLVRETYRRLRGRKPEPYIPQVTEWTVTQGAPLDISGSEAFADYEWPADLLTAAAVYRWRYRDPATGLWGEWMDYDPGTTVHVPTPGCEVEFRGTYETT